MEGTSTWAIELSDYFVGHDQIIADPVRPFLKGETRLCSTPDRIRFGGDTGAVDSMLEVEESLGHVNQFLHDRPIEVQAELDELKAKVHRLGQRCSAGRRIFSLIFLMRVRKYLSYHSEPLNRHCCIKVRGVTL